MNFNVKRYYYGIVKRRLLALVIFIIPAVFLIVSAIFPDRYTVVQNVTISEDSPVALLTNPVGFMAFKELNEDPSAFFLNAYALNKITGTLLSGWAEKYGPVMDDVIKTSMNMVLAGKNTVQISYFGKSREVGDILVSFYSDRLVKKALEGLVRSNNEGPGIMPDLSGGIEVYEIRAVWRPERLRPLIYCTMASIILVLILFGFLEWNDPSFKSERQIARYIGLPILGNVPDLNKVAALIRAEESNRM
ncbi:MAG: hypothetical protein KKD44_09365 [Proteobacteria bacterium]|nr:hypothetical protein [Pseudomonadota bacterium]